MKQCTSRVRAAVRVSSMTPTRRERLIAAAEHVFVEMGYGAASMDGIARRAGMSKKTIYQVFETKQDLFAAVIESAARRACRDHRWRRLRCIVPA